MRSFILLFLLIATSFVSINAQENSFLKRVTTFSLESTELKTVKKIWVYLPKNYNAKNKKFPVIYILEGQNIFNQQNTKDWNIDEMLAKLHDNVILVGIEDDKNMKPDIAAYLDFVAKTIKPKIDSQFRTKSDSHNTAILGSDDNGLIAFKAALQYQNVFGKAGVLFPTVTENDSIYEEILKVKKLKSKIFLFCAAGENARMAKNIYKMEYALNTNRCYCLDLTKVVIAKEEQSNEKLWRQGFEKAYLWLM